MRIQHNIAALSSYRNLTNNNTAVSKSLEKLSSGYRINRAGDDAAGLAISEKMRAQITGLETAQKNANDGISLVQTAEGALTEVHSMLNRMVELANQSANGTYADDVDRENLQAEVDSLLDEVNRISKATNFNGINLLDGSLGLNTKTFQINDSTPAVEAQTFDGKALGVTSLHPSDATDGAEPGFTINLADYKVKMNDNTDNTAAKDSVITLTIGGETVKIRDDANAIKSDTNSTAIKFTTNQAADTDNPTAGASKAANDIAALYNNKFAVIGTDVYKMEVKDNTSIKFTYQGQKTAEGYFEKTDAKGKVTADSFVPTGNVVFNITNATAQNRDNCHLTAVTDPKVGADRVRSGATLKLTQDIINAGSLKIGETTFTFDNTKTEAEASGNTIGTKGLSGDELLKAVTRQFSNKTTTLKDSTGTAKNFTIGRGNATDTIEIEEAVQADSKDYGNFSLADLQKQFSQSRGQANAKSSVTLKAVPKVGDSIEIGGTTYVFGNGNGQVKIGADAEASAKNLAAKIGSSASANGATVTVSAANATDAAPKIGSSGLSLQIGDTADDFNRLTVEVNSMSASSLGIADVDISTQGGAQNAVDKIKAAINLVSSQRGKLGAVQNRLEHTINNLSVTTENITAAESRIRDVDMAKEMMAYTKNNILVQSAQAMLAQANQIPQGVLQLLQ